jgi:tetratricopeptide (TPR) repeat protein
MMTVWPLFSRIRNMRRLAVALVVAVLPAACASDDVGGAGDRDRTIAPGETLTGNYLAARHARTVREDSAAAEFLMAALEKAPDDQVLLRRASMVLILDGRIHEAAEFARRLVAFDDTEVLTHLVIAVDDIHQGRLTEAEARLAALPESSITPFLQPTLRAWTLYGLGRTDDAVAALEPLLDNNALAPLYNLHAALINDAAGNGEAAARHAEAAIEGQTTVSLRMVELLGGVFERAGRRDRALELYDSYAAEHSNFPVLAPTLARLRSGGAAAREIDSAAAGAAEALFDGAGALSRQNTRETGLVLGRLGLDLRPNFPVLQMLVANFLESYERLDEANRLYAAIDPSSPLSRQARLSIALNLNQMDRFEEAAAELRALAREQPADAEPLIDLGDILRRREHYEEAVEAYDEAVARIGTLEPQHWRILYARGMALERAKQWSRAEADFLQALKFEPDQPFVLNYLGYSWVEQGQNLDKAQAMIRRAVELRPDDGYIVDSLGWVYYQLGNHKEAVVELERAVELRPEDPVINDHLGDAYWAAGRQREARYQWRTVLALGPEPDLKARIETKLQKGLVKEANAVSHD